MPREKHLQRTDKELRDEMLRFQRIRGLSSRKASEEIGIARETFMKAKRNPEHHFQAAVREKIEDTLEAWKEECMNEQTANYGQPETSLQKEVQVLRTSVVSQTDKLTPVEYGDLRSLIVVLEHACRQWELRYGK